MYVEHLREKRYHELTYSHPSRPDFTLDDNDLALRCPLDNGHFPKTPQHDLDLLDRLPLDLLQPLLTQLDLCTLTDLRRINQRGRDVVDSIPEYRIIITHAPDALRALLSVKAARYVTCESLYVKLCMSQCEHYEKFGGYLYLLTCKHLYYDYLIRRDEYILL